MAGNYDDQNVFAKILRGELPCNRVHETEHSLAFSDIAPIAPHHVLVIPKGPYVCFDDFSSNASPEEIVDFVKAVGDVCRQLGVAPDSGGNGYRLLSNAGPDGVQVVPHLHIHIVAGRNLGPMLSRVLR
ncbi:MAG: HIT domain-containing protein [Rhodobacteraceae bacterium]|nr:HIT domain-containing protein [Paracoccaceae bacterium]